MAWVKLHDDILGDPKLMRAARRGGAELVLLPWLLAFASKAADHGRLSVGATAAEPEDIAYQVPGVTAAQIEACLRSCVAIGVLSMDDDGCFRFAKWEDRQAKPSDSKTAWRERKQRSRAKKKAGHAPSAGHGVTGDESTPGNGDVTPRHATEKRRGEEKRREKNSKSGPRRVTNTDVGHATDLPAESWVQTGVAWWTKAVGSMTHGRFGKALSGVVQAHGWPAVEGDMAAWVAKRKADDRTCKLEWYADEASARITAEPPPMWDAERKCLTPYGERMTRPDKVPA